MPLPSDEGVKILVKIAVVIVGIVLLIIAVVLVIGGVLLGGYC